ncbi:hypothetical protein PCAR4_810087 [Paraburkholderia caribensis]|nr:hypothetical protein PCAR4_810087 [Paraburkholderia caribensis]
MGTRRALRVATGLGIEANSPILVRFLKVIAFSQSQSTADGIDHDETRPEELAEVTLKEMARSCHPGIRLATDVR